MAALALAGAAAAQEVVVGHVEVDQALAPVATPNCGGGVVYDAGVFSHAYNVGPNDTTIVMKFDLPAGTVVDQVCVCLTRNSGAPSSQDFQFVAYDADGPGGQPGTLLGSAGATATSIPIFPSVQFYSLAIPASDPLTDETVYIGARWPGSSLFMCGDRSPGTPQRTSFGSPNLGATWTNMATLFPNAIPRAMGIRVDATAGGSSCIPSGTTGCLIGGRFRVEMVWRDAASKPFAPANRSNLGTDTATILYFNNPNNLEVLLKMVNACALNNRFWVFYAATTNVGFEITVTDTQTGQSKKYSNPVGKAAAPIQDTSAFATCP